MRYVALAVLSLALSACGGSTPKPEAPATKASPAEAKALAQAAAEPLPMGTIRRSSVRAVLALGPGAFLQRVTLDEQAVFASGKFHGFRLSALNDQELFKGVDLKPGDVVTRINGFPIEHPEDALQAFNSLEVASELRVEYEREAVPRELRYTILDDVPPAPPPARQLPPAKTITGAPPPAKK
jgi:type II secretory pathway component PulC